MTGETDLGRLLATMRPTLHPGEFVFTTAEEELVGVEPVVMVREAEGVTLVLDRAQADAQGLTYDYVAAMVTLQVHSSLEAVGLTAAVSQALTERGISCNIVAGYFHDHLFVPHGHGPEVVELLADLARRHR